jgi:uncharacterized protein
MSIAKICFGQVRHARLKPAINKFAYSVFTLRIPMRQRKAHSKGISQIGLGDNKLSWLTFYDKDHGRGENDSLEWALNLVKQEGITDIDGEVWLQTFPRVLGYVFNPVSFWFFENRSGELKAILAEVNNTFGERHCYLLSNPDGQPIQWGQSFLSNKVFHVSPFCEVKGEYHFRFFSKPGSGQHVARIEYHDQGPLLITSVNGIEQDIDLKSIIWSAIRYPAMSIGVIVRIHWQALRLWLKGVQFHSKPTPPSTEVSK